MSEVDECDSWSSSGLATCRCSRGCDEKTGGQLKSEPVQGDLSKALGSSNPWMIRGLPWKVPPGSIKL